MKTLVKVLVVAFVVIMFCPACQPDPDPVITCPYSCGEMQVLIDAGTPLENSNNWVPINTITPGEENSAWQVSSVLTQVMFDQGAQWVYGGGSYNSAPRDYNELYKLDFMLEEESVLDFTAYIDDQAQFYLIDQGVTPTCSDDTLLLSSHNYFYNSLDACNLWCTDGHNFLSNCLEAGNYTLYVRHRNNPSTPATTPFGLIFVADCRSVTWHCGSIQLYHTMTDYWRFIPGDASADIPTSFPVDEYLTLASNDGLYQSIDAWYEEANTHGFACVDFCFDELGNLVAWNPILEDTGSCCEPCGVEYCPYSSDDMEVYTGSGPLDDVDNWVPINIIPQGEEYSSWSNIVTTDLNSAARWVYGGNEGYTSTPRDYNKLYKLDFVLEEESILDFTAFIDDQAQFYIVVHGDIPTPAPGTLLLNPPHAYFYNSLDECNLWCPDGHSFQSDCLPPGCYTLYIRHRNNPSTPATTPFGMIFSTKCLPCRNVCTWTDCGFVHSNSYDGTANIAKIKLRDCTTGEDMILQGGPSLGAINASSVTWGTPNVRDYRKACAKYCYIVENGINKMGIMHLTSTERKYDRFRKIRYYH